MQARPFVYKRLRPRVIEKMKPSSSPTQNAHQHACTKTRLARYIQVALSINPSIPQTHPTTASLPHCLRKQTDHPATKIHARPLQQSILALLHTITSHSTLHPSQYILPSQLYQDRAILCAIAPVNGHLAPTQAFKKGLLAKQLSHPQ